MASAAFRDSKALNWGLLHADAPFGQNNHRSKSIAKLPNQSFEKSRKRASKLSGSEACCGAPRDKSVPGGPLELGDNRILGRSTLCGFLRTERATILRRSLFFLYGHSIPNAASGASF